MANISKRPVGRPPKTGGWQKISTRMASEWADACGLLETKHNTTLADVMSDAIVASPLEALRVLSSYIPKNVDVTLNAEGNFSDALLRASELMRSEEATPAIIDVEVED